MKNGVFHNEIFIKKNGPKLMKNSFNQSITIFKKG